jgi:hypothetical protein
MRPDYAKLNAETEALENVACLMSQIAIGFAIGFVLIAATFWG